MKTILSALLWFVKPMKDGKSLSGKFYYLLPNNGSIGVSAQYSTTFKELFIPAVLILM